jgi:hypothetical protein
MRYVLIYCFALTAAACSQNQTTQGYFPLESGHQWTYLTTTEWENLVVERANLTLSTHGEERIDGRAAWRRRSDQGVDYWIGQDETGVFRLASKSDLDDEPKLDDKKRYVIKEPLQTGTTWQSTTTAYLLHRRQEFPREIRHTHPSVPMTYSIEVVGEPVSTRTGSFNDCLRIKGIATVRLYADPVVGWKDIPLVTTEWYCKGVGLVKLVREERAGSTFLGGGTYAMELTTWN